MNVTTRAHFHVRIVELLKRDPRKHAPATAADSYDWVAQAVSILAELAPLLEPAVEPVQPAITLRDKIAIEAMKALYPHNPQTRFGRIATMAYEQADEMLCARDGTPVADLELAAAAQDVVNAYYGRFGVDAITTTRLTGPIDEEIEALVAALNPDKEKTQ